MTRLRAFFRDEAGATSLEYGLIAALLAVTMIGALDHLGVRLKHTLNDVSQEL